MGCWVGGRGSRGVGAHAHWLALTNTSFTILPNRVTTSLVHHCFAQPIDFVLWSWSFWPWFVAPYKCESGDLTTRQNHCSREGNNSHDRINYKVAFDRVYYTPHEDSRFMGYRPIQNSAFLHLISLEVSTLF